MVELSTTEHLGVFGDMWLVSTLRYLPCPKKSDRDHTQQIVNMIDLEQGLAAPEWRQVCLPLTQVLHHKVFLLEAWKGGNTHLFGTHPQLGLKPIQSTSHPALWQVFFASGAFKDLLLAIGSSCRRTRVGVSLQGGTTGFPSAYPAAMVV